MSEKVNLEGWRCAADDPPNVVDAEEMSVWLCGPGWMEPVAATYAGGEFVTEYAVIRITKYTPDPENFNLDYDQWAQDASHWKPRPSRHPRTPGFLE